MTARWWPSVWKRWLNGDSGGRGRGITCWHGSLLLTEFWFIDIASFSWLLTGTNYIGPSGWYVLQLQPHQTVKLHLIVPLVQALGTVLSTGLVPGNEGDRKQGLFFFCSGGAYTLVEEEKRGRRSNRRKWEELGYCHLLWRTENKMLTLLCLKKVWGGMNLIRGNIASELLLIN